MDVVAKIRFVRMSPYKARDLARALQGLPVEAALRLVKFSERKAARVFLKALESAIANAENNADLSADQLYVREAIVDPGPSLKRYWPRSRGMVSPIRRRMSHVRIVLTDEKPRKRK